MKNFIFSPFEKWLIWITVLSIGWVYILPIHIFDTEPTQKSILHALFLFFLIISSAISVILLPIVLTKLFVVKYRIRAERPYNDKVIYYKTEALILHFWIIICWSWEPVGMTKETSKGLEDFMGGRYYYTNIFSSKEDAIAAIEKHKLDIKKERAKFFNRPKPKLEKITYV